MGLINRTNINIEKNKTKEELEAEMRIAETQAEASKSADRVMVEAKIKQNEKEDRLSRPWAHESNFYSDSSISEIVFPENVENTLKTVEAIISRKRKELKDYIDKEINVNVIEYIKFIIYGWIFSIPSTIQSIIGKPKIVTQVRPSLDKIQEGIKKLHLLDNYETNFNAAHLSTEVRELNGYLDTIQAKTKSVVYTKIALTALLWIGCAIYSVVDSYSRHHHK
jgi:hypothetical protein